MLILGENLILVKEIEKVNKIKLLGFENLTFIPFDRRLMDKSLLTEKEKNWINSYHHQVLEKVGPHVESIVMEWLKKAVLPI